MRDHPLRKAMASTATIRETAKERLSRYRRAARQRPHQEWGDEEEMRKEALAVHKAYGPARERANKTPFSE